MKVSNIVIASLALVLVQFSVINAEVGTKKAPTRKFLKAVRGKQKELNEKNLAKENSWGGGSSGYDHSHSYGRKLWDSGEGSYGSYGRKLMDSDEVEAVA